MSDLSIATVSLASKEPVSGVSLDAYVKCRRNGETVHSFQEEDGTEPLSADPASPFGVRYRWLRSPDTAENGKRHVCHIHPERPGAYYCGFWKSEYSAYGYPFSDACHCSLECFQRSWKLQLTYWEKAQAAKQAAAEGAASLKQCCFRVGCPHCCDGRVCPRRHVCLAYLDHVPRLGK